MRVCRLFYIFLILYLFVVSPCQAQNLVDMMPTAEVESHKSRVRDLVEFLEFALNTIGNSKTLTRDKNIIISQSYLKIFEHPKVQIEDDLNENRDIITRKDIQAYLSDIDFFFKHVEFKFNIEDISHYVNANGDIYFLVSMTRNLKGITIENDSVNSMKIRYLEVNFNEKERDLKIASIYSNRLSEEEGLMNWWQNLPYPWTDIFFLRLVRSLIGSRLLIWLSEHKSTSIFFIDSNPAKLRIRVLDTFSFLIFFRPDKASSEVMRL